MKKSLLTLFLMVGIIISGFHNVHAQAVTGVQLDQHTLSLAQWDFAQLNAVVFPENALNQNVIWRSSLPNAIEVDQQGGIFAMTDGIAVITVRTEDGNFTDSCVVTCQVNDAAYIRAFSFANDAHTANISDNQQLVTAFVSHGSDASNLTVQSYQLSPGAVITPLPESIHDYSDTVSFVVKAIDGTEKTWKVTAQVMPDLSSYEKFELTFNSAPQGWIGAPVSWSENGINFRIDYPTEESTWGPSADIGDYTGNGITIALHPAKFFINSQAREKYIMAISFDVFENCGDDCTTIGFRGEDTSVISIPASGRYYQFFDQKDKKIQEIELLSFESEFRNIVLYLADTGNVVNQIPIANAGSNQAVNEGDTVTLDATASSDPDGDSLTYLWYNDNGIHFSDSAFSTPKFIAPDVDENTTFAIMLRVNDGRVYSDPDTVFITVQKVNRPPVAWIDPSDFYCYEGDTSLIFGHYSYDPDGDPLSYHWWAQAGSQIRFIDSTEMDPDIILPMVKKDTVFEVYLYVKDGLLNSQVDTLFVHVLNQNHAPVAVLQKHTVSVNDGDTVYLDGSASYDPDGDSLTYFWNSNSSVYIHREGDSAWFLAPTVTQPTPYVFLLSVSDGNLTSEVVKDTVWVQHQNRRPVADAGYPMSVFEGDSTYLFGSYSSDPDQDRLSFSWTAPEGFWISDSTQSEPKIAAPNVLHDTTFNFVLRVFDGQLWSEPDTCFVTVRNNNQPPVAEIVSTEMIFYGVSVNEGDTLWIDGTPSYDPDGDPLRYIWHIPKDFVVDHADSSYVMIVAPQVRQTTSFDASLTVMDQLTSSAPNEFIIRVQNVNQSPVADAGKGFSILEGQEARLDGLGSYDPDGDSLRFSWVAPDGIVLDDAHSATPAFTTPDISEPTVLTFNLMVSDGTLVSAEAPVEVTVLPVQAVLRVAPLLSGGALSMKDYRVTLYHKEDSKWERKNLYSFIEDNINCYAVSPGEWMVSIEPANESSGFVTTFSGDVVSWSEGNGTVVNSNDDIRLEINCVPVTYYPAGTGYITGYIYRDSTDVPSARNAVYQTNVEQDLPPAENVSIFLYRSSDDALLGSRSTGTDGSFMFDQLANGTYYLLVQLPGYDANTPWDVEVSDGNQNVDNVNFVVDENKGTVTDIKTNQEVKFIIYPNPVQNRLTIQLDENPDASGVDVELYDLTGKLLMTKTVFEKTVRFEMQFLNKGVYLLRITQKGKLSIKKVMKQ
ncbi:MAG: T9SS type A sorting domain-containing protein [Bacteroidales bacterium]|nr:T9SS type A sorting domain-containing protein [Bacteroidales bacterium]